ncbi:DUF1330 domain-containing protein [Vibrio sp. T187]|uniref:DUF1330 domain-containing protein n=1 Tax=Vibrio TaxID=662 RepID=UPI0010CA124C|nr:MULTISPECIES: DUF1330 domain-containing protein [Vibrio]MBW3695279.1 DUF1330 domain-containing protein [Vibrio sp. T187]
MPAYMLTFVRIHDHEAHQRDYLIKAHAILEKHGGKALAVTDDVDVHEGNMPQGRVILVEFPSKQHAEAFYTDPDYQPLKQLRSTLLDADMAIFDAINAGQSL